VTRTDGDRRSGFERLYAAHYAEIAGYVRRRVAETEADDVTAHVFAVAWRRLDKVPPPPGDRLWLFGVARNCVADHRRGEQRRLRLHARLVQDAATAGPLAADRETIYEPVRAALGALRPRDREALQLVLWEELSHAEAAEVLGCTVNAFELRYRRARTAVREAMTSMQPARGPLVSNPATSRTTP
jgi:RNA polymerase sigma-70 factor, ECF subfamily